MIRYVVYKSGDHYTVHNGVEYAIHCFNDSSLGRSIESLAAFHNARGEDFEIFNEDTSKYVRASWLKTLADVMATE